MKYIVLMVNGLSDQPIAEKDNRTPLQLAETPHLDRLAAGGRCGSVRNIPEDLPAGNEVSYLSLLGYDPAPSRLGVARFEAEALGVDLADGELPLCCDFVILQSSHNDMIMKDYTAGQLGRDEARSLLNALEQQMADEVTFFSGGGYHNLMVTRKFSLAQPLEPPHELIGEGIRQHMPQGEANKELVFLMNQAQIILHHHPLNQARAKNGEDVINSVWFWGNGNGGRETLAPFADRFGKQASVVSASLLLKGMALKAGMDAPDVEGATGFPDTDFQAKVNTALQELESRDVVYLHIAGAEVASLHGNIDDTMLALEDVDREVVGPLMEAVDRRDDLSLLLVENHMSSVNLMKYTKDPVLFVAYPSGKGADEVKIFNEEMVLSGSEHFKSGSELIEAFLNNRL
ncbi:MAG: phosphoglycerate mutase [Nitrospinaceae bacterium]|nr:phosphoglycerate mutase [Nitrospinaceae bacterium]NIR57330.1 phosphoglycerate mutase [Nitrospinaceae bacterium]NIS87782.1 phosphoglycerate mutase [Nitrospinaceae bacterium]NIT84652.1 phosphoglycerate mutase [Nitrospinaceae bacterium]NIU46831.1 phosphoglycerate mutase [Nitrospinaceae bacterium]